MLQIYRTSSLYLQAVYRRRVTGAGCTGSPLRTAAAALGADPGMVAGPRVAYAAAKYAGLPAAHRAPSPRPGQLGASGRQHGLALGTEHSGTAETEPPHWAIPGLGRPEAPT